MYSAALSPEQADDLFTHLTYGNSSLLGTRPLTLGCSGYNNKQTTYTAYGMGYGLLAYDMVERFLLHYFGMSCHTYTRGTWTTPEAVHPDRDVRGRIRAAAPQTSPRAGMGGWGRGLGGGCSLARASPPHSQRTHSQRTHAYWSSIRFLLASGQAAGATIARPLPSRAAR